jgi:hypothetical protein
MKKLLFIFVLILATSCYKPYKPHVMPTGKGELKKRQIKRDFTN